MKLSIQICADKEWPCIKSIFKVRDNRLQLSPFGECFDDPLGSIECRWYHSGATKTRAAAACQYAICTWHPDTIINLGTCGGVAHNVKELDIILVNKTIQYDVIERFGELSESFQKDQETIIDVSWVRNVEALKSPILERLPVRTRISALNVGADCKRQRYWRLIGSQLLSRRFVS